MSNPKEEDYVNQRVAEAETFNTKLDEQNKVVDKQLIV